MAKAPYDKHYVEPRIFGAPLTELISFFAELPEKIQVWDLGAGQGRDTLALAEQGHRVRAFDISALGLEQIAAEADERFPGQVDVRVADMHGVKIDSECDAVLMDAMFHFLTRDEAKEIGLLKKLTADLKAGGIIALAVIATAKTRAVLDELLRDAWSDWEILRDVLEKHADTGGEYRILILRKPGPAPKTGDA